jgi:hypothetical protein
MKSKIIPSVRPLGSGHGTSFSELAKQIQKSKLKSLSKKSLFFILLGFACTTAQSQDINDAMRYAQTNLSGTARFQAMGGAFGALGGDFSAIHINPAGSSIFANTQLGITLSLYGTCNKADFYGTKTSENNTAFDINQAGGVLVFKNPNDKSGWKKFAIGVDYENNNSYDNRVYVSGTNPYHSIADYFLSHANGIGQGGITLSTLDNANFFDLRYSDGQAFIGYQSFIISPDTNNPNNSTYHSEVPAGTYVQENYLESSGYNGKVAFNASAQYTDKFYFGLNINSYFTDYVQTSTFYEDVFSTSTTGLRNFAFGNELHTIGNGFSFQLGAIAKITPSLRAGVTYDSPTWYTLTDELISVADSRGYFDAANPNTLVDRNSISDIRLPFDSYRLRTPGKWTGSLAYVFNKSGLISFDFGIKDYGNTGLSRRDADYYGLRTATNDFSLVNNQMGSLLDYAAEFRVGAEKKIKNFSLRAGYRYEQSPYKNGKTIGDLTGFSGGFGYTFGYTKLDLAYAHLQRTTQQSLFSQGFTDAPTIKSQNNNVTLTATFGL